LALAEKKHPQMILMEIEALKVLNKFRIIVWKNVNDYENNTTIRKSLF